MYRRTSDGRWVGTWAEPTSAPGRGNRRSVTGATYCGVLRRFSEASPIDPTRTEALARGSRKAALAAARAIATHTEAEWIAYGRSVDWTCEYCDRRVSLPTKDHRTPITRGGSDGIDNLAVACKRCNSRKGDLTEAEFRAINLGCAS